MHANKINALYDKHYETAPSPNPKLKASNNSNCEVILNQLTLCQVYSSYFIENTPVTLR